MVSSFADGVSPFASAPKQTKDLMDHFKLNCKDQKLISLEMKIQLFVISLWITCDPFSR